MPVAVDEVDRGPDLVAACCACTIIKVFAIYIPAKRFDVVL